MLLPSPTFNSVDPGIDVSVVGAQIGQGTGPGGSRLVRQLGTRMGAGRMHPSRPALGFARGLSLALSFRLPLFFSSHRLVPTVERTCNAPAIGTPWQGYGSGEPSCSHGRQAVAGYGSSRFRPDHYAKRLPGTCTPVAS